MAKTKARSIKRKNLAAVTKASVKAALVKASNDKRREPPGTLTGFWINDEELQELGVTAEQLATDVAKGVKDALGIAVKAEVIRLPGGVLTGFVPPPILR
jgi:hypothetical protein